MSDKTPILIAFECERAGQFNVWRYDTPQTKCVLFSVTADSVESAVNIAIKAINHDH